MAFAPSLAKQWYKDLSVEELEKKYKELESNYYFKSKEEQIKYILKCFMNSSSDTNINSTRIAIEDLLKEKTGKVYKMKTKTFKLTTTDIIDYFAKFSTYKIDKALLVDFFNTLENDEENQWFLLCLFQNEKYFKDFLKELKNNQNKRTIFEKYLKLAKKYYGDNRIIG